MILINIPRGILYIALTLLSYYDQAPWWASPALILYDVRWYTVLGFPRPKKELEGRVLAMPTSSSKWN